MNIAINYIVESALGLGILTLFYYGFLRNRNIPGFSRWYLLLALVFASALPLFHITVLRPEISTMNELVYYGFMLDMVNIYGSIMQQNVVPAVQQHSGIHWLYLVGIALLLIRLAYAMFKIGILQKKTIRQKVLGINVVQSDKIFQPFSFVNTIFVPKTFFQNEDGANILRHESIHVKQKHSFDLILLELVLLVQWFNPFVWLLRKAIAENHEFIADRAVLKTGVSVSDYQRTLLYHVMGTKFDLGTGFSYSLTKKRFKMMKTKVNKKGVFASALLSLMLFAGIFFVAASELNVDALVVPLIPDNEASATIVPDQKNRQQDNKQEVFQIVEEMPQFPGGANAMMTFLSENIKYPKTAQENGIQGRVYVNYVVDTQGKITDVKIARGVDPELDAEALRVVKSMPDWTPGKQRGKNVNVAFMLPINFALGEAKKEVTDGAMVNAGEMKVDYQISKGKGDVKIKGAVYNGKGGPLPGASVILKGTTLGTITDLDGKFLLNITNQYFNESEKDVSISFVGMKTFIINIEKNRANNMEEIVVVSRDNPDVFRIVEKMPQFPGGEAAMMTYLQENINYPDNAKKNGIQGRVYLDFIVNKEGKITDVRVTRGVDPSLDKEAVRVVESMPDWIPGTQRGKKVNVVYTLPINFVLSGGKSKSDKLTIVEDKPEVEDNVVFQIVEEMPEFPGGRDAMMKYLAENIKYPTAAQEKKVQGKVYTSFIVEKNGSIDNIKVVRSIDPALDKEAVRIIKSMPKWKPGIQRGKPVKVSFVVPINFVLQ